MQLRFGSFVSSFILALSQEGDNRDLFHYRLW
jgi:hypothetical protein